MQTEKGLKKKTEKKVPKIIAFRTFPLKLKPLPKGEEELKKKRSPSCWGTSEVQPCFGAPAAFWPTRAGVKLERPPSHGFPNYPWACKGDIPRGSTYSYMIYFGLKLLSIEVLWGLSIYYLIICYMGTWTLWDRCRCRCRGRWRYRQLF